MRKRFGESGARAPAHHVGREDVGETVAVQHVRIPAPQDMDMIHEPLCFPLLLDMLGIIFPVLFEE